MMFVNGKYTPLIPEYLKQPAAWFHTRILVGAGNFLTPQFASINKITHVINCAMEYDSPKWFRSEHPEKYECIQAIDSIAVNILDWFPKFETAMLKFLREGDGVVYVHCQAGMNRSGSLALAYVCKHFHLDLDAMVVTVRRQRPVLLQNPVFMNQVREFINGRIQSEKNTRLDVDRVHDGNSGLFTSDHSTGSEGLEDDADESTDGTRISTSNHFQPLFTE
jgi:atypical dual specificity phosphatase